MTVKQRFQFLNTLRFGLKDKVMFSIRQGYQVLKAVIILDPVKMMNKPTLRQKLPIGFFPNKNVLTDISVPIGSWVFRSGNKNISTALYSAPLPIVVFLPKFDKVAHFAVCPSALSFATWTSLSSEGYCRCATVKAQMVRMLSGFMGTVRTPLGASLYRFTAIWTRVLIPFVKFNLSLVSHNHIISQLPIYCNVVEWVQEIIYAADKLSIPVFLKDNLRPLLAPSAMAWHKDEPYTGLVSLRQEWPLPIERR